MQRHGFAVAIDATNSCSLDRWYKHRPLIWSSLVEVKMCHWAGMVQVKIGLFESTLT
jgi:hypothetical protein